MTNPLSKYVQDQQDKAADLNAILQVVNHLHFEGACEGGRVVLLGIASEMSQELSIALDSVNLPEVAAHD